MRQEDRDRGSAAGKQPGGARSPEGPAPPPAPKEKAVTRIDAEDEVDEASDESFPASDPPSFNPGHT